MFLSSDVSSSKLAQWETVSKEFNYTPLQTKSFHVMGILFQNFEAAAHLLRIDRKVQADFYLQAYLVACTSLEILGSCLVNAQSPRQNLESGFDFAKLNTISTHGMSYSIEDLVALRHLAAHGHCHEYTRTSRLVVLHIELLDSFPEKLLNAYKNYFDNLRIDQNARQKLADSEVEPYIHFKVVSGQSFRNPVDYGYSKLKAIYQEKQAIEEVFASTRDWKVQQRKNSRK